MTRTAPVIAWVVVFGCEGGDTLDGEGIPPGGATDTDVVDTAIEVSDSGTIDTGTPGTPWEDLVAPPTDVDADCWSWAVLFDDAAEEPLSLYLSTYDAGTLTLLTFLGDFDPDGQMDYGYVYTWDATFENLLRAEYDDDQNGTLDRVIIVTYDADGLRLSWEEDADGDGLFERYWTYAYEDGVVVAALADETGDRVVDTVWRYTYDASDRLLRLDGDDGDDGTVDSTITYVYDDTVTEGVAYTRSVDDDLDGIPEETRTYVYDDLDLLLHYTYATNGGDLSVYDYTYNADGDVIARASEATYAGEFNDRQSSVYTYEAPGRVSLELTDIDFTGEGDADFVTKQTTTWFCP